MVMFLSNGDGDTSRITLVERSIPLVDGASPIRISLTAWVQKRG